MKQIYLIASSDARWVAHQRGGLVNDLVPSQMRDENLLEILGSGNTPLKLDDVLPQILGELAMIPFLPDSRRVVVVHDLADFFAGGQRSLSAAKTAKKKKADKTPARLSAAEVFIAFAEKDLPATENVVIFSTFIDQSRGQYLDEKNELYLFIGKSRLGEVLRPPYREIDPVFKMSDALLERNAPECLRHFRGIYREDMRARLFHELLRNVRFLLQAKVIEKVEGGGKSATRIAGYLPDDKRLNLLMQKDFVQNKIRRGAGRFQMRELMRAMERLLEINRFLYPSQSDPYVPDVKLLFETFILEFCAK